MSEWDAYPEVQQPQGQDPWAAFPEAKATPTQQAQPAKPEQGWGEYVHSMVTGSADQALKIPTAGFLDEGNAGMRAVIRGIGNLVTGKPADIGGNYDRALADERGRMHQFQEEHPIASGISNVLGGLATGGIGAGIAPGAGAVASTGRALIPDLVAGAKSLPGIAARSAGVGAASGAVGGFGDAEGGFEKRLAGAGVGATVGGVLGGAIPAGAATVKGTWNAGKALLGKVDADEAASDFAIRALTRDKFDLSGVGPMPATDKPMAIADVAGGNTRRLGRTVITTPGEGSDHATQFLHERQYGQGDRVKDDIDTHISGQDRIDSVEARKAQRQAESRPLYKQAFEAAPVHSDRVQQFLDDPVAKAGMRHGLEIQRLEALAKNEKFDPTDYGITGFNEAGDPIMEKVPNMRLLDATKRGLDAQLSQYPRHAITGKLELDERGKAIDMVRRSYLEELDKLNPDYEAARAAYAEPSRLLDATNKGREVMNGNTQETVRNFEKMDDPAKDAYRIGAADTLKETVGNSRDGAHVVPRIYGGDNARARVNMLADDPKAFERKMAQEDAMNKTRSTGTGGSSTASTLADTEDAGAIKSALISAAHGNGLIASGLAGIGKLVSKSGGMNEKTAEKLSHILFNADQDQNANALANLVARAQQKQDGVRKVGGVTGGGVQTIGNLIGQYLGPEERR
jgi:hypothetical protein